MAAIRLLILTGCRKREIPHLRWDQVDFEAAELVLPKSKTGPRKVSLSPRGGARVGEHRASAGQSLGGSRAGSRDGRCEASTKPGGSGLRARRAQGHTHSELPAQLRLASARPWGRVCP